MLSGDVAEGFRTAPKGGVAVGQGDPDGLPVHGFRPSSTVWPASSSTSSAGKDRTTIVTR